MSVSKSNIEHFDCLYIRIYEIYEPFKLYLRSSQYFPLHPGRHPVSQIPFSLLQPVHVLLQSREQFSPKNPTAHAIQKITIC